MDWNDVRHFLALARLGSARGAGASLGVSHSTVVRRIEALEVRLAARLFDRTRDGYALTDAGRQMLPGAERIEREMAALERGLAGQDERLAGSVSMTCCDNFVAGLLLPDLARFCEACPEIELNVTTDSRAFDLSKREADVAIRTKARGAQPPEHLVGRKVAPVVVANYVAVEHAERLRPDGAQARWLAVDPRKTQEAMIAASSYPDLPAWGAFSSLELLVQAALQGLGLVMLPTYVGDPEPGLQRLPRADATHLADLWLLCHPDLRDNARILATRKSIADALQKHAPLFRGAGWSDDAPARPENAPSTGDRGDLH